MLSRRLRSPYFLTAVCLVGALLFSEGCQLLTSHLTHWHMLDQETQEDPVKAVGGHAILFAPEPEKQPLHREQLAAAAPDVLIAYYAPLIVQQRVDTTAQPHPYPAEYDLVGEARVKRDDKGGFKAFVAGPPTVYAIYQKIKIEGNEHVQLTYTAWYPAHPRLKLIDLEEADIDSLVLRVTLDAQNAPLFYETIAACGCFHKVFLEKWIEEKATQTFGPPESGKKYAVEKTVKDAIDWEVAGVVDSPHNQPRRPVVFIQAGNHHVIGMGSTARVRAPEGADVRPYALTDYADLYSVAVADSQERAPFFDMGKGGKVWGAERKERFIFSLGGVDAAGQPRANDQIKLHFDQSTWGDPTIYGKFLRLPPGTL